MLAITLAGTASRAGAQTTAPSACTYPSCGLSIAARWNGLAVVRGENRALAANLNFFLPRSVSAAFGHSGEPGADSALAWASRAVHRRRMAAFATDVGTGVLAVAAIMAARNNGFDASSRNTAGVGAIFFAVGVPLQFSADNALSRAVWWYNRRFAP